jgi:hypothetical protein
MSAFVVVLEQPDQQDDDEYEGNSSSAYVHESAPFSSVPLPTRGRDSENERYTRHQMK